VEPAGHTHAFDIYCGPFADGTSDLPQTVVSKLKENVQPFERVGLIVLGSLASVGLALRALDRHWRVEDWLQRSHNPAQAATSRFDVSVPAPVLGGAGLVLLFGLSLVGCYAYYPSSDEVFEEMRILRGEVLTAALSGNQKHAGHFIPIWDDWTRRLQVGVF